MIDKGSPLSVRQQCRLLEVNRSLVYYQRAVVDDTELANALCELYRQFPVYGYRRLTACLRREGYAVNGKRVLRLMREMGLRAIYPGLKTTVVDKAASKYPYLLKDMVIVRAHQVWQVDITYLRTDHGFMYLTALIDMYTRFVVGWSLSNSLDTETCLRTLERAISTYGVPDMINSDQGCQFTSEAWIQALESQGILISMSGKGRSNDNAHIERLWRTLKSEWTLIHGLRTVAEYKAHLPKFINWYNHLRPHQALQYKTPGEALKKLAHGYVDKAYALPHIPTSPATTKEKNSLNL
jgi:putative transposase